MHWLHELLPPDGADFLLRHAQAIRRTPTSAGLTYGDRPLPLLGLPLVLTASETILLRRLSWAVAEGLESFTRRTIRAGHLKGMGFSPLQEDFVGMPTGYRRAVPISRIDAYWTAKGPQFLEINTDGTAYIDYADRLNHHYLEIMGPFLSPHAGRFESLSVRETLFETILESYRQFSAAAGRRPKADPLVAILDYHDVKTRQDQENLAHYFSGRGLPSMTVDPRALKFRAGRLLHGDRPIDIIYRRATSREIFARPQDFKAFLAAYRARAVCVVGSFRSDLGFHKASLAWTLTALPPKARRRLEPFIPEILIGSSAGRKPAVLASSIPGHGRPDGEASAADRAIRRGGDYLYKPANRNQGKGIRLGSQVGRSAWHALVKKARRGEGALQRIINPPTFRFPSELGLGRYGPLRLNLGIFVIGGRFAGLCARLTPDLILREHSPEWLVPVYCMRQAGSLPYSLPRTPARDGRMARRVRPPQNR